jgi:hypothetical protein
MINCDEFDQHADDLALGRVDEPQRSQLLVHASTCPHCQSLLEGLGTVVDRLLLVAPHVEPPAGFESRALARIVATPVPGRARFRVPLWAAAIVALSVGTTGFAVAHLLDQRSTPVVAPSAVILTPGNVDLGAVQLLADPAPHILVAIRAPRPEPGLRNCELQRPDGTWVHVGSWQVADIASGVWATGIDPALLNATAMRITAQDGAILGAATFR